ncbi:glycine cleavage system protein T [Mycobacterium tuberculosis]|nr:glycine cleavage system protein T [Mycobacterium tuberculosis]
MSDVPELIHGPLEDRHRELGASFAEFGGWLMPVSYAGTVSEHNATRTAVGLFDVSHLGKALVRGPGAAQFVNSALTNDLGRIGPGKAQYTLCCTESGGVIDDLIAYYVSDDEIFLVPNAANTAAVVGALQAAAPGGLSITNLHRSYAVLAVQGPCSTDVLTALGLPTEMDYMGYADASYSGVPVRVCRTGYTGEHGYELLPPWESAGVVFDDCWRRYQPRAASPPASVLATHCALKWAIRCTGTSFRWTSRRCRPDAAGRSAGGRTPSLVVRRCWPRKRPGRGGCCGGCAWSVAVCCAPGWLCLSGMRRLGSPRRERFLPRCRSASGWR